MTGPTVIILAGSDDAGDRPKNPEQPRPVDDEFAAGAGSDLKGSLAALRRAGLRARQIAQQTGTDLILARAGQVVRVPPKTTS